MKKVLLIFPLLSFVFLSVYSQVSEGGSPLSIQYNLDDTNVPLVELNAPSTEELENDVVIHHSDDYIIGKVLPATINLVSMGKWEELADGSKICRLKIKAELAKSLVCYYENFWLPEGGKLFLYNETKNQIIGAFTSSNNPESGLFATEAIQGDIVTIEYNQRKERALAPQITIEEVGYIFRNFSPFAMGESAANISQYFGDSQSCEVNVNCSEGTNWQDQKKAVVDILEKIGAYLGLCSGSLVNNTKLDCTPYILTAYHCGEGSSSSDRNQWIFYFNYEAPSCSNPSSASGLYSQSITGCSLISYGDISGGSDFYLVKLNSSVPSSYNAYYAGWDNAGTASTSGVGIHHPSGDIKKISTYTSTLKTTTIFGGKSSAHWEVKWTATTNGHGITEGGSSGSPIFNSNGLIIGTLSTGSSYCSTPTSPDQYGKLQYHWDKNGSTSTYRLKDWLDPLNSGVTSLSGSFSPCSTTTAVVAAFTANNTTIYEGDVVTFTDQSTGSPTSWQWSFSGGTPTSSTSQNPSITYNTAGTYDVSLKASNGNSNDTETKTAYITVLKASTTLNAAFTANNTTIYEGDTVDFTDQSTGNPTIWKWTCTGGTPSSSTSQNPSISYSTAGSYDVSLKISDGNAFDTETKTAYITVLKAQSQNVCDTITNVSDNSSILLPGTDQGGYLGGHNGYGDLAKADYFSVYPNSTPLVGALLAFGKATYSSSTKKIAVKVWDNTGSGGSPGSVLASQNIKISSIATDVANNSSTLVTFTNPITISTPFYLGIEYTYANGDTVALYTNDDGETPVGTAWDKWNDNTWHAFSASNDWNINVSLYVKAIFCPTQTTAIKENESISNLLLYPNPSNGKVTITVDLKSQSKLDITVLNTLGEIVQNLSVANTLGGNYELDMTNNAKGIYFVKVNTDKDCLIQQLILSE